MTFKFSFSNTLMPGVCLIFSSLVLAAPEEKTQAHALPTELRFTSIFKNYKGYTDQAVQSWQGAIERVGQIGGWHAYAKEMADQPAANTSPTAHPHPAPDNETKP